jgi:hypothetical protein
MAIVINTKKIFFMIFEFGYMPKDEACLQWVAMNRLLFIENFPHGYSKQKAALNEGITKRF